MMRLANTIGYTMTGIFVVAMLGIGSEILLGQDITGGDSGLLTLGTELGARHGDWTRLLFLTGFVAVTSSPLLGARRSCRSLGSRCSCCSTRGGSRATGARAGCPTSC